MQVTFNTKKLVKLIVKESVVTKDSPTLLYRLLHDAAKIIFYIDKKNLRYPSLSCIIIPSSAVLYFPNGAHGIKLSRASSPRGPDPRRSVIARGRCLGLRSVGER